MSSSMKVDLTGLDKLVARIDSQEVRREIEKIPQSKAIAALVAQAIADNFAQQGPGWAPLSAKTIRSSIKNKKLKKQLKGMTDKEVMLHESRERAKGEVGEQFRMILQKSGLLKKTVTTPGLAFGATYTNDEGETGSNIYRVEGTTLVWGTDLAYAGVHNSGDAEKHIPKREFLIIREQWMKRINDLMVEQIMDILRNALRGGS